MPAREAQRVILIQDISAEKTVQGHKEVLPQVHVACSEAGF